MPLDLPPDAGKVWLPLRPAIIRPAEHALLKPGAFPSCTRAERRAIVADLLRTKRITPNMVGAVAVIVPVVAFPVAAGGHRYWRWYITASNGGSTVIFGEATLKVAGTNVMPLMSGYTSGSITVSASAEDITYYAWKAFDHQTGYSAGNYVWEASSLPAWLKVDFGSGNAQDITSYSITPRQIDGTVYAPSAWLFQWSESGNDADWTTVDTQSGVTSGWTADVERTFSF